MGIFFNRPKVNNFDLIATNVGIIYEIIDESAFGHTISEDQKLFATAVMDLETYIMNGEFNYDDIQRAVLSSKIGTLTSAYSFARKTHGFMDYDEFSNLLSLVMQIELMVFECDTHIDPYLIMDELIKQKEHLRELVGKTQRAPRNFEVFNTVKMFAMKYLNDDGFKKKVLHFSL